MGGQSSSYSSQWTETVTNVDSFNKTFNSTSNISDAGNVSIQLPDVAGSSGGSSIMTILLVVGMIGATLLVFFKR